MLSAASSGPSSGGDSNGSRDWVQGIENTAWGDLSKLLHGRIEYWGVRIVAGGFFTHGFKTVLLEDLSSRGLRFLGPTDQPDG